MQEGEVILSSSASGGDYLDPTSDDDNNNKVQEEIVEDVGVKHGLPPPTPSIEDPRSKTPIRKAHEVLEGVRRLTIIDEPSEEEEEIAMKLYKGMKLKNLIKDRIYHFHSYEKCFIVSEAIDFMIQTKMATSRNEAVILGQLMETKMELWHHVCDETHVFEDEYLFFRFEQDESDSDDMPSHSTSKRRLKRQSRVTKMAAVGNALNNAATQNDTTSSGDDAQLQLMQKTQGTRHMPLSKSLIIDDELLEKIATSLKTQVHVQPYKNCFVASEAIDIMLKLNLVTSREEGIQVGCLLQSPSKCNFWYHAYDNSTNFDDKHMFFKLTKVNNFDLRRVGENNNDEDNNKYDDEYLNRISTKLRNDIKMEDKTYHFKTYKQVFVASDVVDYMLANNICETRIEAVQLCKLLQSKQNLWHHVTNDHQFKDSYLFFRFT